MKIRIIKIISLVAILACCISSSFAQEIIKVKGTIIDEKSNEPVPYANIAIVGVPMGTISNLDGDFELKVPVELENHNFCISAVGYRQLTFTVSDFKNKTKQTFNITPENYKIEAVTIEAKSMVYYKMIKEAVANMENNYLDKPFNYETYYRYEYRKDKKLERMREAAVKIYDSKGYKRSNTISVYKERGYKFLQVRRNFEPKSLRDGSTNLDDLLEMDIVRLRGNVLDTNYLDLYDLKLEELTEYDGDTVYVVAYKSNKPSLSTTGDVYATSYEGKLYINKKDKAIVKNVTYVEASNYSELGRSVFINETKQEWKPVTIFYTFTVIYKKHQNQYCLSYVNYNRVNKFKHKTEYKFLNEEINSEMMVNKITQRNVEKIEKRAYYENMPFDKKFWESYNFLLDVK